MMAAPNTMTGSGSFLNLNNKPIVTSRMTILGISGVHPSFEDCATPKDNTSPSDRSDGGGRDSLHKGHDSGAFAVLFEIGRGNDREQVAGEKRRQGSDRRSGATGPEIGSSSRSRDTR